MHTNRWILVLISIGLSMLSIFVTNPYTIGLHDHWYMIPWIKDLMDPSLYPFDPIIAQRQYHYSLLYKLLAWSPLQLHTSFFILYLVILSTCLYMSMRIFECFYKKHLFLAPLFLLLTWHTPGGTDTFAPMILMRLSSMPFLFAALYFWLKVQPWFAWPVLGIAFLLHPTSALYLSAFFGIHQLLQVSYRKSKAYWWSVLGFVLFASPVFFSKFSAEKTGFPGFWADDFWLETIRTRSAHHAFPDTWSNKVVLSFCLLFIVWMIMLFVTKEKKLKNFMWAVGLGTCLIILAGFWFTYVTPAFLAIQVQPFRVARWFIILCLLFIPICVTQLSFKKAINKWAVFAIALCVCTAAFLQSRVLFQWYTFLILSLALLLSFEKRSVFGYLGLLAALVVLAFNFKVKNLVISPQPALKDVQLYNYVQNNTPKDALFVAPSDLKFFRNFAERSVLINWWDGTFGYFDYNFNTTWRNQYTTLYGAFDEKATEPIAASSASLLKNHESVSKKYLICRKAKTNPNFTLIWQDEHYKLYEFLHPLSQ